MWQKLEKFWDSLSVPLAKFWDSLSVPLAKVLAILFIVYMLLGLVTHFEILTAMLTASCATILVPVMVFYIDKYWMPQYDTFKEIRQGNIAAAFVLGSLFIAAAVTFHAVLK